MPLCESIAARHASATSTPIALGTTSGYGLLTGVGYTTVLNGGFTLGGALIAGVNNAGKSYTLTEQSSGFNIIQFAHLPRANVLEPSSIALLGTGMVALAGFGRRQRARA